MEAIEILTHELCGTFISRFSVGDTWEFYFGHYWLVAHNVISENEGLLNRLLQNDYHSFQNTVDKEYISKCSIVAAHMRKLVTGIKLDEKYNLTIEFENDSKLVIPTNVDIVDWQWCLNKTGNDPYHDYHVACFWNGEIQINEEFK